MNQDEKEPKPLNGGQIAQLEAFIRDNFVFFQIKVGTPWDNGEFLAFEGKIPREEFVLAGMGVLAREIGQAGYEMEKHIRQVLIAPPTKKRSARSVRR